MSNPNPNPNFRIRLRVGVRVRSLIGGAMPANALRYRGGVGGKGVPHDGISFSTTTG